MYMQHLDVWEVKGLIPDRDLDFFFVPRSCHVYQFTFHILLPSLRFTKFIHTHDDFDSADPSTMQETCHIWSQLCSPCVVVCQWIEHPPSVWEVTHPVFGRSPTQCLGGHGFHGDSDFFFVNLSHTVHLHILIYMIHRAKYWKKVFVIICLDYSKT